jgi:hypothetical protein
MSPCLNHIMGMVRFSLCLCQTSLMETLYLVSRVLDHRYITRGRSKPQLQYLVHWEGYGSEHYTWEPETNIRDAPESLVKYADYLKSVSKELKPPVVQRGAGVAVKRAAVN